MHDVERPLVAAARARARSAARRPPPTTIATASPSGTCVRVLRRVRQQRADVLAVDVLHRDEVLAGRLADVVDLHDVLVMQRGGDARLVEEHPDEALIPRVLGADPLEHDVALEAFDAVASPEQDVRHPARRQVLQHHVSSETSPHYH